MKYQDVIIIAVVLIVLGLIVYFRFFKNRKKPCHGCSYAKNCSHQCDKE